MAKIDLKKGQHEMYGTKPNAAQISEIALQDIVRNLEQPRTYFSKEAARELAASLAEQGQIQPIHVKPGKDDKFIIVAGERRWRAANDLNWSHINAIVLHRDDTDIISLIENIQRENLTPVEEALAFKKVKRDRKLNDSALGKFVGKQRSTVVEILSISKLPDAILDKLPEYPNVTKSQLIIVAKEKDPKAQAILWTRIKQGRSTVQDTRAMKSGKKPLSESTPEERAIQSLEGGLNRLEKLAGLSATSVAQVKALRSRINKILRTFA